MSAEPHALIQFIHSSGLVSPATTVAIAAQFYAVSFPRGAFVLKEGKMCNEYFFLEQGFMRAFAIDNDGAEITTSFYGSGQVVFEVDSFFNRTASRENIQTLTDCAAWVISYEGLNGLFHSLPEFREFGRYILVKGFAALKGRMLGMITEDAETRYAALVKHHPEILQHAPLKQIATYLGVTDTSLSRIRKGFASK